jgi:N-acetylglutamate synthase-like GNAT family acetyltransferase
MRIRKFRKGDEKKIKKLIGGILLEIFKKEPKGLEDLDNIKKNYKIFWVVEDKGKIIATAGINRDNIAKRLYIYKKYRKKGLGKKLYYLQESYLKKKGIRKIKLSTTPQMKDAIKFYEKKGFKKIKIDKKKNQIFFEKILK